MSSFDFLVLPEYTFDMEKNKLESKAWFRLVKVLFIFTYLLTLLVIFIFAYYSRPQSIIDTYNSKIICDNGKKYLAGENNIEVFKVKYAIDGYYETEKDKVSLLCLGYEHGFVPDFITDAEMSKIENKNQLYKIEIVNKSDGSWWSYIGYIILALFTASLIFEIIRRTFLYIVSGKKFF